MNWFKELTNGNVDYIHTNKLSEYIKSKEDYINNFNKAIEIAYSTIEGRKLIEKWRRLPNKPTMVRAQLVRNGIFVPVGTDANKIPSYTTRYDPENNKIYWNPEISIALTDENGRLVSLASPASILFHEAFHLTDDNLLYNMSKRSSVYDKRKKYPNDAEYYAVTNTNKIRHELGEVERFDYERNSGQVRSIHDISTSSETNYHDNGNREESKRNIEIENSLDKGNIRKTTILKTYYKRGCTRLALNFTPITQRF